VFLTVASARVSPHFKALFPQGEVHPHLSESLSFLESAPFFNLFPPGTAILLDTSVLSLKANRDDIAIYNDGDLPFPGRMLKHEFEVLLVTQDIEILDLPAFFGKGLPGRCGERSRVFSKNKDLFRHGEDLLLGTGLCYQI